MIAFVLGLLLKGRVYCVCMSAFFKNKNKKQTIASVLLRPSIIFSDNNIVCPIANTCFILRTARAGLLRCGPLCVGWDWRFGPACCYFGQGQGFVITK